MTATASDRARHQVDHALLGGAVFAAGILFWRTHSYHHRYAPAQRRRLWGAG